MKFIENYKNKINKPKFPKQNFFRTNFKFSEQNVKKCNFENSYNFNITKQKSYKKHIPANHFSEFFPESTWIWLTCT